MPQSLKYTDTLPSHPMASPPVPPFDRLSPRVRALLPGLGITAPTEAQQTALSPPALIIPDHTGMSWRYPGSGEWCIRGT